MARQAALQLLLVEDNPDHAALARNAIVKSKQQMYQVDVSGSAEEAMGRLKDGHFHMVVSDFHLTGKTGLELLGWLNHQEIDLPFIMVTGEGDEKTAVKAMQDGAYNYIVKDDNYLKVLPHVVDETFIRYHADKERERFELEIRQKNVQLEKANRELKTLDRLKSAFVDSVSHDIRSPLNSVRESIALILDGVVNPVEEKGKKVLEIAQRSIERLTKMINDLLDFSKLERGKMRLYIEPCDIQVLVDESIATLKSLADKKKINLQFKPKEDFPKVSCDGDRLVQVFTNLIGNAIKFTPEQGTISVDTEVIDSGVKVTVADTGSGIKQEDLERIFERFEQVKGTDSGGIKGTGLGLAICRELVKLHQGEIWAESELGKGSRFIVSLPITQPVQRAGVSLETENEKG
ncbi:MAG: hypothetical protein A3G87_01405 [Omnitrophica bacterium RIFCSPLOWO2_12_FULL_50_11]|nr:MAG: hypothetical protein A3G87_01405 [Omnitrophica bacterium RIFCSPLOWO2_12_FULL_50_11]